MADINKFTTKEVLNKVLLDSSGNAIAANSRTSQEALNAVLDTSNNRLNVSLGGSNTISGDVTITGDLTVQGNGTGNYDEIVEGNLILTAGSKLGVGTGDVTLSLPAVIKGPNTDTGDAKGQLQIEDDAAIANTPTMGIRFQGQYTSGGDTATFGGITVQKANTSNGNLASNMFFSTRNTSGTPVTAITIDKDQNATIAGTATVSGGILTLGTADASSGHINAFENMSFNIDTDNDDTNRFFEFSINSSSGAGTELMRLTEAGQLGINVQPLVALHVSGDIQLDDSAPFLLFKETGGNKDMQFKLQTDGRMSLLNDNASTEVLTVLQTGDVGIGTATPKHYSGTTGTVLSVHSATHRGILELSGASNSDDGIIGAVTFANTENDADKGALAQLFAYVETSDSNGGNDSGGHLAFLTRPDGGTITERMRITSAGNVGIGNTTPSDFESSASDLVVGSTTGDNGITIVSGTTSKGKIHFADGTSGDASYRGYIFYDHNSDAGMGFGVGASDIMKLDANSRISLSNNDASGAVGTTLFGYNAGNNVADTGINSTFVGHQSGTAVTTADYNTAIGYRSLFDIVDGGYNSALGSFALGGQHGTTADASSENVAIGYSAMGGIFDNSATTDQCVAIGALAMNGALNNADGSVAVGYKSLLGLTSGGGNTAVGFEALKTISTGTTSTAVGFEALELATGSGNTALGYGAGNVISTGIENTIIGGFSNPSANNATNETVIGSGTTGQGSNKVTLGNSSVTDVYMAQDSGATVHCAGINFSATQPAPDAGTSTSEVLDGYEEGTWTPVYSDGTNNATSYNTDQQQGNYTRIGNMVHVQMQIQPDNIGSVSGSLRIEGLPFTSKNVGARPAFSIGFVAGMSITASESIHGFIDNGGTHIRLRQFDSTGGDGDLTNTEFPVNGRLIGSATYLV